MNIFLFNIFSISIYYFLVFLNNNQGLVLFITFIVIAWYAWEVRKSNKILAGRPIITIIKNVADNNLKTNTLELKNVGTNIAFNIKVRFFIQ